MPTDPGPFDLDKVRLVLNPNHLAEPKPVTPNFYAELGDFAGHILFQQFEFDKAWPTWEMHPEGDEIVYLVEGDTDFALSLPDGEKTVRVSQPGSYVIVPKGVWHTARPHKKTRMVFFTPGNGTVNAKTPGGEPL
jgi:mannose-6-phosphate isomerase-like protein (cupin superfamily)